MEGQQESVEAMQARHRKEQRDLQSRITSKKKNATKKTRKGVNDECAELERQLKARQEQELAVAQGGGAEDGENGEEEGEGLPGRDTADQVADQLKNTLLSDERPPPLQPTQPASDAPSPPPPAKKRNRQKERMARRAAEQEAASEAAEAEAANMTDHRTIEKTYLLKEFKANGLVEKEIQPDGHCLFSAVADQLQQQAVPLGGEAGAAPYRATRQRATEYMRAHADDFAPFLDEDFDAYVAKMRATAEWGGQLELTALARAYGVEIRVLQDGRTEIIQPGDAADGDAPKQIWLAYYRHGYGLGEHYNSLRKAA